jgi:hypothetical protein
MDSKTILLVVFGFLGGIFAIVGAVGDWDWFMTNNKARIFVSLFGRTGARIFYIVLGLFLVGLAVWMLGR